MKYESKTDFLHDQLGVIKKGDTVEATAEQAATPLIFGYFEAADSKPVEVAEKPAKKAK